jgi:hypothetical protein
LVFEATAFEGKIWGPSAASGEDVKDPLNSELESLHRGGNTPVDGRRVAHMNKIQADPRTQIIAATVLLGVALQALKEGSDDPEEQPDYLIRETLEILAGVAKDLA